MRRKIKLMCYNDEGYGFDNIKEMSPQLADAITHLLDVTRSEEQSELKATNEALSSSLDYNINEVKTLRKRVSELEKELENANKRVMESDLGSVIVAKFATQVDSKHKMETILDCMYNPRFENVHLNNESPLWLSALTRYYDNREEVLDILRSFKWTEIPSKINNFKLPLDWSDKELNSWMTHMSHNYVCNGQLYDWGNLRWWGSFSLEDITTFYEKHRGEYSEVPFQYVFMNPLMKTEKYLKMLGIEIAGNHSELIKGISQMELSEDELGFIIRCSLAYLEEHYKPISETNNNFKQWLWQNVNLIYNHDVTKYLYETYANTFMGTEQLLKLPTFFVVQHTQKYPEYLGKLLSSDKISAHDKKTLCDCASNYYENLINEGNV